MRANAAWAALAMGIFAPAAGAAEADPQLALFRAVAETRGFTLGRPRAPQFTPDGAAVLFLRGGARDPVLRLFELDLRTAIERELAAPERLLGSALEVLPTEERARRERARISTRGFTSFEISKDGAYILLTLSGRLYLLQRQTGRTEQLPGEGWIDPHFSPDGRYIAAVANRELHVVDVAARTVRAITSGATATLRHGVAEFVAQEEMGRRRGYWWSPDSRYLVYQQNDESDVEVRHVADPLNPQAVPQTQAYPRAGTPNTRVRLAIVERTGGTARWIDWDRQAYPYLARVKWEELAAPPTILVQDRAQQNQLLLAVDPATGATRELLRETDAAWLELDGTATPSWLRDGRHFLWTTERNGTWQVELRDASGRFQRFLTTPEFGYRKLLGIDERRQQIYLEGSDDAQQIHLWRLPLSGRPPLRLTTAPGHHHAIFSEDRAAYIHSYELLDGRIGWDILSRDGHRRGALRSVAETPSVTPRVELTRTATTPAFDAAITRPRDFVRGKKYPAILSVYAGPTVKVVNATPGDHLGDQLLAEQGYVVIRIDGRGTPWRGRDWLRAVRGNLIDVALQDQIAGLRSLAAQYPEIDPDRVGVIGWSFGGYFAAMATLRRPDVFRAGIAGAPVVTWENYDTHYTERYLGLPQENPDAYRVSNVTTYAAQLERPLLLIHGLGDDNVYVQHTLQLCDALFLAGKHYEFLPLTATHMVTEPLVRLRQQQRIVEFFDRALK